MKMFDAVVPNRNDLFNKLPTNEIAARYREIYGLGPEVGIDDVRRHVEVEGGLTDKLILSSEAARSSAFEEAYTELFQQFPWLSSAKASSSLDPWAALMKPNARVYEIGSGAGVLADFLSKRNFDYTATDIARERREAPAQARPGLRWRETDGVHLDRYEEPESYDYIISDQVVEHLHPDDILTHFRTARILLKPGGSYIVRTPHRRHGGHDLSRVFGLKTAVFLHLHEFTYREFDYICHETGHSKALGVVSLGPVSRKLGWWKASRLFYIYMTLLDNIDSSLNGTRRGKEAFRKLSRLLQPFSGVWCQLIR